MTTHGTEAMYETGCRCNHCIPAHARHHRALAAARAADRTDHGTQACYTAGCRCTPCKNAHARHAASYRARHNTNPRPRIVKTYPDTFVVLVPLPPRMTVERARRYARSIVLELPEARDLEFSGDWQWRILTRPTGRYIAGRVPARSSRPQAEDQAAALAAADVFAGHVPALARLVREEVA